MFKMPLTHLWYSYKTDFSSADLFYVVSNKAPQYDNLHRLYQWRDRQKWTNQPRCCGALQRDVGDKSSRALVCEVMIGTSTTEHDVITILPTFTSHVYGKLIKEQNAKEMYKLSPVINSKQVRYFPN